MEENWRTCGFQSRWKSKEAGLRHQGRNQQQLVSKKAESKASFLHALLPGLLPESATHIVLGLPTEKSYQENPLYKCQMLNAYFILGLIKVKAKINHLRHPFFYILISIFEQFVEDDIFSTVYILYLFVKNQVAVAVWTYIWVLYPTDL